MTRLASKFDELKQKGEKALVLFITAGDQPLAELPGLLCALVEGGADVIEVGVPFSDPYGEGSTIQGSSQRSLELGTTPRGILDAIRTARPEVPVVTMGYYNTVLRYGLEEYARLARDAGVSGTIISDLVPDEAEEWARVSEVAGLATIFLAAPTSTEERLDQVCLRSTGFVYAVSRTGVTGSTSEVPPEARELVTRIRARTEKPVCVGFGVSTPEHVRMVCEVADGAVVGSWLVDLLHREWQGGAGRKAVVRGVAELKAATRG